MSGRARRYSLLRSEKSVEILDEIGVDAEEDIVEVRAELLYVVGRQLGRSDGSERIVELPLLEHAQQFRAEIFLTGDISAQNREDIGDVFLFGLVAFRQLACVGAD